MKIVIFKEHHGDRYFDVSTKEKADRVSLAMLKERFVDNASWYIDPNEKPPEKPVIPNGVDLEADNEFSKLAKSQMAYYERAMDEYARERKFDDAVKATLANKDGQYAWKLLSRRKHHEDEGFTFVELEEAGDV